MFVSIETNGATHIAIYIPGDTAAQSLPQLANMLEQNAKFFRNGYHEHAVVKPSMTITLGDRLKFRDADEEVEVIAPGVVLDETFVVATPEVFSSNAKERKKAGEENSRLRTELQFVRGELERAKERIEALTSDEPV